MNMFIYSFINLYIWIVIWPDFILSFICFTQDTSFFCLSLNPCNTCGAVYVIFHFHIGSHLFFFYLKTFYPLSFTFSRLFVFATPSLTLASLMSSSFLLFVFAHVCWKAKKDSKPRINRRQSLAKFHKVKEEKKKKGNANWRDCWASGSWSHEPQGAYGGW